MSVNAFKDASQQYLTIRRDERKSAPTASTPFQTLGDEILANGIWYKAGSYSPSSGYTWDQLTQQSTGGGGTGLTWSAISASQNLLTNHGYILQNTSASIALALPSSSAVGDTMMVVADLGCVGFSITQANGQQMVMSPTFATTPTAAGGISVNSPAQAIVVQFICTVANTRWVVITDFTIFAS